MNVPDDRFKWLCDLYKPKSEVPAFLEIVDIAGLVRHAPYTYLSSLFCQLQMVLNVQTAIVSSVDMTGSDIYQSVECYSSKRNTMWNLQGSG